MPLDNFVNCAKVTVSTGYDGSATSIVLNAGNGALLPATPFNAMWWNASDYSDPTDDPNREIVRVTTIATDTLTITRAVEAVSGSTSPSAQTHNTAGKIYKMVAGVTAKTLNTDIKPIVVGNASALNQGASIGTSNIAVPAAGTYRVSVYLVTNSAGTGTVDVTIGYTDEIGAKTLQLPDTLFMVAGAFSTGSAVIQVGAAGNVTYATAWVTSGTYDIYVTVERLI